MTQANGTASLVHSETAAPARSAEIRPATPRPMIARHIARRDRFTRQVIDKRQEMTLRQGRPKGALAAILPKLPISYEALTSSAAIPAPVPKCGLTSDTRRFAPRLHEDGTCAHGSWSLIRGRSLEGHDAR